MSASDDRLDELIRKAMRIRERWAPQKQGCPKEEHLVLYLENRLQEAEREALESHVADCDFCIELISAYSQADEALPKEATPVLKKEAIDRVKSLVHASENVLKHRFHFPVRLQWRWSLAWAIPLLIMLLSPIGYFVGKSLLKEVVENRVQQTLSHSGFSITGLEVGWGQILLNGIVLAQETTDLVSVKNVSVKFEPQTLVKGKLTLKQVILDSPHVHIGEEGLDLPSLLDKLFPEDQAWREEALSLSSAQVLVKNGSVDIIDEQVQAGPVVLRFDQLNLNVDGLSYPSAQTASVLINGRIVGVTQDGRIKGQGEFDPVDQKLTLRLQLQKVDMLTLLPYYSDHVSAHLESGTADIDLSIELARGELSISGKFILYGFKFADYEGVFFGVFPEVLEEYTNTGLEIPFNLSGQADMGREYFLGALLREFEKGLQEQSG
jgi:hypothetical protein